MKKFCLSLMLTLMLTFWCGAGYYGLGTGAAFGQDYYSPSLSCSPSEPNCYGDYYRAPYSDPLSQLLYYVAPPSGQYQSYQRQETNRERRVRERRELKDRKERERQGRRDRYRQDY